MRRFLTVLVCTLVCSAVTPAGTQDQFERQVRKQLAEVGKELGKQGYELTHQVFVGRLKESETETVTFRLRRDVKYAVVGVCDQDCKDLDLRVLDPAQREVGRDAEKDDVPVVELQADKNGEYDVRVDMAECKDNPCAYGIGIFATEQDAFERQVRTQLETAAKKLGQQGFTLTHDIYTDALKQGETEDVTVDLDRGSRYLIVGVCDNDCKDLDLQLLNSAGREVDRDVERDDYPMVAAQPSRDETFTVRAIMAQCTDNPCRYGFGVFSSTRRAEENAGSRRSAPAHPSHPAR
jgi:hypothetical protein